MAPRMRTALKHTVVCASFVLLTACEQVPPPPSGSAASSASSTAVESVGPSSTSAADCIVSGCSGEVCVDASEGGVFTTCVFKPEFACYRSARCERQSDGGCGWTETPELLTCLENASVQAPEDAPQ